MRLTRRPVLAGLAGLLWTGIEHAAAQPGEHPLKGRTVDFAITGLADWPQSRIALDMLPGFVALAKARDGYDVTLHVDLAPVATLFEKTVGALAAKSPTPTLLIIENEWLDALASPKWVAALNPVIQANKALDVDWLVPAIRAAFQISPFESNNRWAMPQSGDVLALFIRQDLLAAPGEAEAFKAKYGVDLPQTWEDFEKLSWDDVAKVLGFFTRPEQGLFGLGSHWSRDANALASPAVSFILGAGGEIWRAKGGQVEGVLNTDANAASIAAYKALLEYQPPDALGYGVAELTAAFAKGKLFAALQWVGAGPDMLAGLMREKVLVVPAPAFPAPGGPARRYVIGGQSWAINAFSDEAQRQVAIDLLKWWFQPETLLDFARRGGNPVDRATLTRPDIDSLQPWFRSYRTMLQSTGDLWHDPHFQGLLAAQQDALAGFVSGRVSDPRHALDVAACRQQTLLFDQGTAERQPDEGCKALKL